MMVSHSDAPGGAPPATGVVPMTNEAYHASAGISKSHLDAVARSPLHYWQQYVNPDREPRVATPALVLGSAIHAAVLEPDVFAMGYAVAPDVDRRTKAGKEEYAAWLVENKGAIALTPDQMDVALGARDAVRRNARCKPFLAEGMAETSFLASTPDTGALVKCRTDWLDTRSMCIVDVKTTEDASPDAFLRSVLRYRYDVQEAWYRWVISQAIGGDDFQRWVFLVVEKTPPYAVALYELPRAMVRTALMRATSDLLTILNCRQANRWPGYTDATEDGVVQLDVPVWAQRKLGMNAPETDFPEDDE